MNVFILGTGRCGTKSFISACRYIQNYSVGHETRVARVGRERLNYPDWHIEADNRLAWFLGRLEELYGQEAFYVHLLRDPEETARSLAKRVFPGSIIRAYADGILMPRTDPENATKNALVIARDYVHTVTKNIEGFMVNKPYQVTINLENIEDCFPQFLDLIGAEGDHQAILGELRKPKNISRR